MNPNLFVFVMCTLPHPDSPDLSSIWQYPERVHALKRRHHFVKRLVVSCELCSPAKNVRDQQVSSTRVTVSSHSPLKLLVDS